MTSAPAKEFHQQTIDKFLLDDLTHLVQLAVREDLGRSFDLTTIAVVPPGLPARASIVARSSGRAAGVELIEPILECIHAQVSVKLQVSDGNEFAAGDTLAVLTGDARDVLTSERIVLNFLGRLCGIATWTAEHVLELADCKAKLYDTRKTTPGWRRLEKYAVRCGGGTNHRNGLHEAIMIKDNHLACHQRLTGHLLSPTEAVTKAREFLTQQDEADSDAIVEIEVDSLEQLEAALVARPDIVLLDNMSNDQLKRAVSMRDDLNSGVELEASGGVNLQTLASIGATGVDRISVGALTHSAINLDLGLDWVFGES